MLSGQTTFNLKPGEEESFIVVCTPDSKGPLSGTLRFQPADVDEISVSLEAQGTSASILPCGAVAPGAAGGRASDIAVLLIMILFLTAASIRASRLTHSE